MSSRYTTHSFLAFLALLLVPLRSAIASQAVRSTADVHLFQAGLECCGPLAV